MLVNNHMNFLNYNIIKHLKQQSSIFKLINIYNNNKLLININK